MIMNSTGHMEMSTGTHMDHSNMNNMNTMNNMDNMDNMNMNMNMNSTKCGEGMMGMMVRFNLLFCNVCIRCTGSHLPPFDYLCS